MPIQPKNIFDTINKIRQNPNIAINQIKQQFKKFQNNSVYRNKRDIKIRTLSGKAGWQQAILSIQRQKSKGNLMWNSLLERAVQEYKQGVSEDQGINPFQVIKSICSYEGTISFNVNQSDTEQDIVQIVSAMIVGDGDQKKGSRTAIFHPLYRQFACAVRKAGNKIVIYTVFAQSVSQPVLNNNSPKKQQSKPSSQTRSNWSETPTGKFQEQKSISNNTNLKYKSEEEQINTKQSYMKRGKQLIAELNKIRKQPKQYVHALKAQLQKFKDDKVINTDYGVITTKQGQAPYYDLISELQTQYALPTIREITGLTLVALQQITQSQSMIQSKVQVQDILDKFCSVSEGVRSIKLRDIQGMPISAMIMRLLVGDGDRKRTARRKMLSPICKAVGCAISKSMLVINVGQTAKDNPGTVQQYIKNLNNQFPAKKSSYPKKQQQTSSKYSGNSYQHGQQLPYFGQKDKNVRNKQYDGERIIIKKTSKSHNESKAGRIYRITEIQIIYNDGQIQKVIEQELLN